MSGVGFIRVKLVTVVKGANIENANRNDAVDTYMAVNVKEAVPGKFTCNG